MDIQITQEQQAIVEELVATGRFASVQEAIAEGIRLLVSEEKLRQEIQLGIDQADRGELVDHDTVFTHLRMIASQTQTSNG